jgi:SAM-dependent methyltransferase
MKLEFVNCDLCGSKKSTLIFVENGFNTVECDSCGLIYINPRPTYPNILSRYNSQAYFDKHEGLYNDWVENSREKLKYLLEVEHSCDLLEIGVGKGHFLQFAATQGYNVFGLDVSQYVISHVESKLGFNVKCGEVNEVDFGIQFDVVCFFDVLSHVYSPTIFLRGISKQLKQGGILLARVGDKGGQWKTFRQGKWHAPDHLYHFSKCLLKESLNNAGLELVKTFPAFDSEYPYLRETFISKNQATLKKLDIYNAAIHKLSLEEGIMDDYYLLARRI